MRTLAPLALLLAGCFDLGPRGYEAGPPATPAASWAVAFAAQQHGKPYCWGGSGPSCYDCSGLTWAAWRAAGKTIPRTSQQQLEALEPIAMNELQPGDILWRPGHVGMYVGNGWAIHAPETGRTVEYQPAHRYRQALRP